MVSAAPVPAIRQPTPEPVNYKVPAALCLLLLGCYWSTIVVTAQLLWSSEDMAHGFFAPVVAIYLIGWDKRSELARLSLAPDWKALPVLLAGAVLGILAAIDGSATLSRLGFMVSLAGSILLLGGLRLLRHTVLAWLLLFYTFPVPAVLYGELTMPLQLLASAISERVFETLGYSVVRDGNILHLAHQTLSVAEACSGLRSLITLSFFTVVYAYFFETSYRMRAAILFLAFPSAILLNVIRIVLTGILSTYDPQFTSGILHETLGWLSIVLAFGLVFIAHEMVRKRIHVKPA